MARPKSDLQRYRKELQALIARLRPKTAMELKSVCVPCGGAGGASSPQDMDDMGSDEQLHDQGVAVLESERQLLVEAEAALARLDAGVFGICLSCGASIPAARLAAVPYAKTCMACS